MIFQGKRAEATAYTTLIYEQEFKSPLISDYYGKVDLAPSDGDDMRWVPAEFVAARLAAAAEAEEKPLPKATDKAIARLVARAFPAQVPTVADYTRTRWDALLRVLWAMLRTGEELDRLDGKLPDRIPPFKEWLIGLGPVDMNALDSAVFEETQRGLFRAGAADGASE